MDPTMTATNTSTGTTGAPSRAGAGRGRGTAGSRGRFPVPPRAPRSNAATRRAIRPSGRTRLRIPELALGLGLAAAGALASVLWASRAPSQRVLVAARALHRGEVLDASMVRWATVSGDRIVAVTDPASLRGGTVAQDVLAGVPMQVAMLQDTNPLAPDEVEVGLALEVGDYPPAVAPGDRVSVVTIAATDPTSLSTLPRVRALAARVRAVTTADVASGARTVVTLVILQSDVGDVLSAARVRLAVLPASDVAMKNSGQR